MEYKPVVVSQRSVALRPGKDRQSSPGVPVVSFIGAGNYSTAVLMPAFKETGIVIKALKAGKNVFVEKPHLILNTQHSPVSQITRIPWGHNLVIIAKCKNLDEALYYVQNAIVHGWSRSVLTHQIESGLWQREGRCSKDNLSKYYLWKKGFVKQLNGTKIV